MVSSSPPGPDSQRPAGAHGWAGIPHAEALATLLALVPSLFVARTILTRLPLGHDHATHLFKAWHFWTELVPSGRLRGWSHYWGFGFPSDELVPCGGELWVGLFRLLTLGQLSWLETYALAFAALMSFKSYAAYRFGRHFFGRAPGVIAAWLTLLDPGAMLEGGWEWHTTWGVWPVTLAASCIALSLVQLDRVLGGGRAREVAAAGALVGASLVTHQIALVAFALAVPLLFLEWLVRPTAARLGDYGRALAALLFGFCLAAFFLVPFFTHTGDTLDLGWLHEPLSIVVARLVEGKTFQNLAPELHYLGLAGGALALAFRARGGLFFAASALACVLLASDVLIRTLHLERMLPTLIKLEVNRLLLVAKLFWFPLAGYACVRLARLGFDGLVRAGLGRGMAVALLAVLGTGSLALPSTQRLLAGLVEKRVTAAEKLPDWGDLQRLVEWSSARRAESREHYRIAYELWRGNHLPTVAPVFDRTPIYKAGTTPTQIFKNLPRAPGDTALYEAMSVRYLVALAPSADPAFRLIERFGSLYVHEFLRYRADPFRVLGPGRAELLEFSDERVRLRLVGTAPGTRLKLHVASYGRWRAEQNGRELEIATVPVYAFRYPMLMEVPAGDGELTFDYVRRPADWLGALLSWLALPGFAAAVVLARRRPELAERLARALAPRRAPIGLLGVVVLAVIVITVALRTRTRQALLPPDSIFQRLEPEQLTLGKESCRKLEPLVFQCGEARVEADAVVAAIWGVHLCMRAPRGEPLAIDVPVELGSFVWGSYDSITRESSGAITVALDGQTLASFPTEPPYLQQQFVQFDTRRRRGERAWLSIRLEGSAVDCFDFRLVR